MHRGVIDATLLPPTFNRGIKRERIEQERKAGELSYFLGPRTLTSVCSLPPQALIS